MKFENKNILVISPEAWDAHHVSKHHYSKELARRRNNVYFLNPPSARSTELIEKNLYVVCFPGHFKGLKFFPRIVRSTFIKNDLLKLQDYLNVEFNVIWNFDSSRFYDLSAISKDIVKICHLVDLSESYNRERLASTSDICLTVSLPIEKELKKWNYRTFNINHGVSSPAQLESDVNLPGDNEIKAIYIGNLNIPYLDHQLAKQLVIANPSVDFIFIGGYSPDNPLKKITRSNIFLLGKVKSSTLASYLDQAEMLLVLYDAYNYEDQVANSHKILEYLLSGKVIISTRSKDYDNSELIQMVKDKADYLKLFDSVKERLDYFNNPEMVKLRKNFALQFTYDKQIERIENIINEMYLGKDSNK